MDNKRKSSGAVSTAAYGILAVVLAVVLIAVVWAVASNRDAAPDENAQTGEASGAETSDNVGGGTDATSKPPESEGVLDEATDTDATDRTDESETAKRNRLGGATVDANMDPEAAEAGRSAAPLTFVLPVQGYVAKGYSEDTMVYSLTMNDYRVHSGVDLASVVGAPVVACAAGTVESIWQDDFMGQCLSVDHGNGLRSVYCGLAETLPQGIDVGVAVTAGQTIAGVGESAVCESADAAHLHFEMTVDGQPTDPFRYLPEALGASAGEDE